jgi:hypothetical protein
MLHLRLAALAAGLSLAGTPSVFAQTPATQLDRIEQKLDTILHRLDQMQHGQVGGIQPTPPAATPGLSSPVRISRTSNAERDFADDDMAGSRIAVLDAADP